MQPLCPACPSGSRVWALTGGWVVGLGQGPAMEGGWTPPGALQTQQAGSCWLPNTDLGLPVGNLTLVSLSQAWLGLMLQISDPTLPHTEELLQGTQHKGSASHRTRRLHPTSPVPFPCASEPHTGKEKSAKPRATGGCRVLWRLPLLGQGVPCKCLFKNWFNEGKLTQHSQTLAVLCYWFLFHLLFTEKNLFGEKKISPLF